MENEELVEQIQAGIKPTENMEQLYLQNRSFIYQQAKKYAAYADMDDLMHDPPVKYPGDFLYLTIGNE